MTQRFINRNFTKEEREEVTLEEFYRIDHVLKSNAALLHVSGIALIACLLAVGAWVVWGNNITMYLSMVTGAVLVLLTVSYWVGVRSCVRVVKAIKKDIAKRKGGSR